MHPPFFAYPVDATLVGLLGDGALHAIALHRVTLWYRVGSAAELRDGVLGGTVRTAALVHSQPAQVQQATGAYAVGTALELPVSVRIVAGRR
jgi:hypothetical protein